MRLAHRLKNHLALTTAMVGASLGAYVRQAYAACSNVGASTYLCTGANSSTQTINADNASVSTAAGFSINTNSGDAITITGDGALSFTDANTSSITATGAGGAGVRLTANANDGSIPASITVNSNGNITGNLYGIRTYIASGTGSISITANGDINGGGYNAIYARNFGNSLTIVTGENSHLVSDYDGIIANGFGAGPTSVTVGGVVTSTDGNGMFGQASMGDLNIITGANSAITGHSGISTSSGWSTGNDSIQFIDIGGDITGTDEYGIYAHNYGWDIIITTRENSNITGQTAGIYANNEGNIYESRAISITVDGDVTGTTKQGILATNGQSGYNFGTDLSVTVGAGANVTGHFTGIETRNYGIGATSITIDGNVTSANWGGAYILNHSNASDINITTGAGSSVTGNYYGIDAKNLGTGSVSIVVDGEVEGSAGYGGIQAYSRGTSMTITTGAGSSVTGGDDGIEAKNYGSGNTSITVNGDVTGNTGRGVFAQGDASSDDMAITTGAGSNITGGDSGIEALTYSAGHISIIANGNVTSNGNNGGINAKSYGSMSIVTGADSVITGNFYGIEADGQTNTGVISVTVNGDVTGTTWSGIWAENEGAGLEVTTNVGSNVTGNYRGINAYNYSHAMNITVNGNLTATTNYAIYAKNNSSATNVSITTGADSNVTGGKYGIWTRNYGTGTTSITVNGNLTGTTEGGIYSSSRANTTGVNITTGAGSNITADNYGIAALHYGSGAITFDINGDVSGANNQGVYAQNTANGSHISITNGASSDITGHVNGIQAKNYGTGNTTIAVSGDVTGNTGRGIYAYSRNAATNMIITTSVDSTVTGHYDAIRAINQGSGVTSVTVNGDVAGTYGIFARDSGSGLNITTAANTTIIGSRQGINTRTYGTGPLTVVLNGDVSSTRANYGYALVAQNDGSATNNTVTLNSGASLSTISSNGQAIYMFGHDIAITLNGDSAVTTIGDGAHGIGANYSTNHHHTFTLNDDSSITTSGDSAHGVYLIYNADENVVNLNGGSIVATGANANGVTVMASYNFFSHGPTSTPYITNNDIIVQNGSTISGTQAIYGNASSQLDITLNGTSSGVTLQGTGGSAIALGAQNDTLAITGTATINGNVTGGAGTDTLTLGSGNITVATSGSNNTISGFESLDITGASVLNGNLDMGANSITLGSGDNLHVNGLLTASTVTIGNNAEFGGNNVFTGNLVVGSGGTVAPGNSIGTVNVVGSATLNTGSSFELEVEGGSTDQLNATSNITIQSGVTLNVVPLSSFSGSSAFLTAGGTLTGTFDTVNMNGVIATLTYTPTSVVITAANPSAFNTQAQATLGSSRLFAGAVADESAAGALSRGKRLWGRGLYKINNRDSSAAFAGFNTNHYGLALGGDRPVSDRWKLGFSLGQVEHHANTKGTADTSHGSATLASVYGTFTQGYGRSKLFSTLGVRAGYHDMEGRRAVGNNNMAATAYSDNSAYEGGAFLQLGAHLPIMHGWNLTPRASVSYAYLTAGGFNERNGGAAALAMDGYQTAAWETREGITLASDRPRYLGAGITGVPNLNFSLTQEYGAGSDRHGTFSNGTPFAMPLDHSTRSFATAGAGLDFAIAPAITGQISYSYSYSPKEIRNDAMMGIQMRF